MSKINIKELKVIAGRSPGTPWITPSELEGVLDELALQLQEEIAGKHKPNIVRDMPFVLGGNVLARMIEKINEFFGTTYESDLNTLMNHFNKPLKKD